MSIWIPPPEYMPNGRQPPVLAPAHILSSEKLYMIKENDNEIDDGREERLLEFIHKHPSIEQIKGHPGAVANAIDEFAQTQDFLMTIGPLKRRTLKEVMAQMHPKPKIVLELGAYVGYTALGLAAILRELHPNQGATVFSFELEPKWASMTSSLIQLAGVEDTVQVQVGKADESLGKLVARGVLKPGDVDVVLLDHWEDRYLADLQLIEGAGLLHEGSVVLADNVVFPGAPEYLKYVRNVEKGDRKISYVSREEASMMPNGWKDSMEISVVQRA